MNNNPYLIGIRIAIPVVLGYLPVGFAFGILAVQAGMTPVTVGLMSYFVYAGSAQLITASLLAGGSSFLAIILMTFVVNLRHLLMSAALIPYLRSWSKIRQAWFAFEMTDETFALNLSRFVSVGVRPKEVLSTNFFSHMGWTMGGIGGALFGDTLTDIKPFGLDFALTGMFIALILPHIKIKRNLLAVISGGFLSIILALFGAGQYNVLLAAAIAASFAAFVPLKEEEQNV